MLVQWERRRVLIWGKTRPELSSRYRELVCTGGVFEDRAGLVRLYPIPLRYLDDEKVFKKYQWIEAFVAKSRSDPRPESYRVRYDDIVVRGEIPTKNGDWDDRAKWILRSEHILHSVEHLQERQKIDGTSLGLIQPRSIEGVRYEKIPEQDKRDFAIRYDRVLAQQDLPLDPETGREIKPLREADFRFKIRFQCGHESCRRVHDFSVLDWELDALYFRLRQRGNRRIPAADKVLRKLETICSSDNDLRFFLGNISNHPHVFTIVGFWWPKRKASDTQLHLFRPSGAFS